MKKALPTMIWVVVFAGLCWAFPPFHIRSLKAVRDAQAGLQFNPTAFVDQFWVGMLLPAKDRAVEVTRILDAMTTDPKLVREQFGRTVGVGSSYYLFVKGAGRVVHANDDRIGLSVQPEGSEPQIVIELGFVFGNAVRDGTGLLDSSRYPNAQEFNDISAALNSIVETNVLPQLKETAKVGRRIQFVGCVEVSDEEQDLKPLKLVPIFVKAD